MAANYVLLETITVGEAGASSVTFNNIPQSGYTDLKIEVSARTSTSAVSEALLLSFNNLTTNFSGIYLSGSGSATYSGTFSRFAGWANSATATASTFSSTSIYIPNYTSSNNKSFCFDSVDENNASSADAGLVAGLWSNTSAINSITMVGSASGSFVRYSTFSLYGLAAVGTTPVVAPYASGGDIIQTDGTYWYHAFLSSGTFTPAKTLSCDYVVIAGGGAGGSELGGGGGAGGLRSTVTATGGGGSLESALALTSNTGYTVTIGAGGSAAGSSRGANGGNSVFASITSVGGGGGGGGGGGATNPGANGGSGGGSGYAGLSSSGGTGTSSQGYAGGTSPASATGGGGGGGAGVVGANGYSTWNGGNGGNGIYTSLTDALGTLAGLGQLSSGHYYFAAGGGGGAYGNLTAGTGGIGGGGAGTANSSTAPTAGTPNTGGGGGGRGSLSGTWAAGANGGSGIVILRYAI